MSTSKHLLCVAWISCWSVFVPHPSVAAAEGQTAEKAPDASQIPSLIEDLKKPSEANKAMTKLAKVGSPAVESLILLLKDERPLVRRDAAFTLGLIRDNRAGLPLIEAVEQTTPQENCAEAVWAIGRLRDRRGVEPLLAILLNRTNEKRLGKR